MPTFVAETDRILSDPANYPSKQMDIVITEHPASAVSTSEPDAPLVVGKPGQIQMDIGVGIYDVLANAPTGQEEAQMYGYHEQSTIPIVKISKDKNNAPDSKSLLVNSSEP